MASNGFGYQSFVHAATGAPLGGSKRDKRKVKQARKSRKANRR